MIKLRHQVFMVSLFAVLFLTACGGGGTGVGKSEATGGGDTTNPAPNKDIDFISLVSFLENEIENDFTELNEVDSGIFNPNDRDRIEQCETGTALVSKYIDSVVADFTDYYGPIIDSDLNGEAPDCSKYSIDVHDFVHGRIEYTNTFTSRPTRSSVSNFIFGDISTSTTNPPPYFYNCGSSIICGLQGSLSRSSKGEIGYGGSLRIKTPYLKYYFAHDFNKQLLNNKEDQPLDRSVFQKFSPQQDIFRNYDITLNSEDHYKGAYSTEKYILDRTKANYLSDNEDDYIKVQLKLSIDLTYSSYTNYGTGKVKYEIKYNTGVGSNKTVTGYVDYHGSEKTIYTTTNGVTKREYGSNVK